MLGTVTTVTKHDVAAAAVANSPNLRGVMSSKASGEPCLMLSHTPPLALVGRP